MFSSRIHWDLRPNRLSALLEEKRQAGRRILDLTESNPTRAGFAYDPKLVIEPFADPRSLLYEPFPAGLPAARHCVSAYYAARGYQIDPRRIVLTTSTSEAYGYLFKLLADPGDEILVPRPSYPLFEFLAALESVRVIQYPLRYDGAWHIDFHALEAAATERARAIVLVNPNNPTGSFLKTFELDRLVSFCQRHQLAIISDEVFADYTFGPDASRVASLSSISEVLGFSLSGLSKTAGLPQMKLGWIVVSGPEALRNQALDRLELIADTYLSVGAPVQHALPKLLSAADSIQNEISGRVRSNLACLRASMGPDCRCHALAVEGGWYAVVRTPRTRTEEEWCLDLLAEDGVLVQPGFFYDFESDGYLVLSLLTPPEVFRAGVQKLIARAG